MEKRMDTKFATKDDLTSMEKRMDKKFASKDDLIIALKDQKEQILDAVDGKLAKQKEEIVREVGEFIGYSCPHIRQARQTINPSRKKA